MKNNERAAAALRVEPSRRVSADGFAARIFLAFLATAGLFYVNIMPAIVDGLVEGLGFTARQAGFVGSANIYGAAAGALLIVFLIRRVVWRPAACVLLGVLILMDLLSMWITLPGAMTAFRLVHGIVGGALVGVGFSVIARTNNPDRTFGVLLVVQFGLGGLGNLFLPRLVPFFGTDVLFLSLIAFSVITAIMLPFLPGYAVKTETGPVTAREPIAIFPLALVLLSIFLFQAANMGLFAFIIGLGRTSGLELSYITTTLAASGWIGIIGPIIVIGIYTKFGRMRPLVLAMIVTAIANWALHFSDNAMIFLVANCAVGITWAFTMPYLLGLTAEFDKAGQMAALGGFASKMGLATGPFAAGLLLGDDNYARLINIAVFALIVALVASVIPAIKHDRIATSRA